jgi:GT2 family glycosyltransferase
MHDLAVVIVWYDDPVDVVLRALRSVAAAVRHLRVQTVVVYQGPDRTTPGEVARTADGVTLLVAENLGFAAGNNRALDVVDARYVLLLNPDAAIVDGVLDDLVAELDRSPDVGAAGVRHIDAEGRPQLVAFTRPSVRRALAEAVGLYGIRRRMVAASALASDVAADADWVVGAFLLIRREALQSVGFLDERFALYWEEADWCRRASDAGWRVRYVPTLTVEHETGRAMSTNAYAQDAFARLMFARKHLNALQRGGVRAAMLLHYGLRYVVRSLPGRLRSPELAARERAALGIVLGRSAPPFWPPTQLAVRPGVSIHAPLAAEWTGHDAEPGSVADGSRTR